MAPQSASDLTLEGLVHDLNNVFETITEAADLLAADSKSSRLAATIHRSVDSGRRILGSFFENSLSPLDFEVILENAVAFASDFLDAVHGPRIQFCRHLEPGIRLRGIPAAWERVLVNLFLNAAQAMEGGGAVEVTARRADDAIEIAVTDTGPGIPPAILPHIFEPRFSTRSSRSGLGLHIVDSIVRQNGGVVSAANRAGGQGAVFTITLPNG